MTDRDPPVPVDWHDALRAYEPSQRIDHAERRLGRAAVRCRDDEQWRRFAMRRVERLTRRIMHALSEPLSDDANADAAIADLRSIHRTLGAMITDHAKLMKARAEAREPSIFDPPSVPRVKRVRRPKKA